MKLCHLDQDSESEILERFNVCLKNRSKNKTPQKFAHIEHFRGCFVETNYFARGSFPEVGQKQKTEKKKKKKKILQGLRVAQAAVTERLAVKSKKSLKNPFFFFKKIKIT